jgi:hypothetical protein
VAEGLSGEIEVLLSGLDTQKSRYSRLVDGAGDGIRTRDLLLGKETCYHCTTPAGRQLLLYAIKVKLVKSHELEDSMRYNRDTRILAGSMGIIDGTLNIK